MKTLILRTLVTLCVSGLLLSAVAQTTPAGTPDDNNAAVSSHPAATGDHCPAAGRRRDERTVGNQPVGRANNGR